MKLKIIKMLISWLSKRYPYLLIEAVCGHGAHVHKNPRKQKVTVNLDGKKVCEGTLDSITAEAVP